VQHIDCNGTALPFGPLYAADLRNRTESAISQKHVFKAMELALTAQAMADHDFVPSSSQQDSRHGTA
jgi:hypothetical protein